jgi:hypothetical protein
MYGGACIDAFVEVSGRPRLYALIITITTITITITINLTLTLTLTLTLNLNLTINLNLTHRPLASTTQRFWASPSACLS